MSSKADIEKQIAELEKVLRAADGSSYSLVAMTVGFQAKRPSTQICKQWLEECGVVAEDVMSCVNRHSTTVPLVCFANGEMPPDNWLLIKGLQPISGEGDDVAKWWTHPLINQRFKEWAANQE